MRIGLDIASLANKHQASQTALIVGDSDFVPAAKYARRKGIDFILDPLWQPIKDRLNEHIDGLRSCTKKQPKSKEDPLHTGGDGHPEDWPPPPPISKTAAHSHNHSHRQRDGKQSSENSRRGPVATERYNRSRALRDRPEERPPISESVLRPLPPPPLCSISRR